MWRYEKMKKTAQENIEKELRNHRKEYERIKRNIQEIGFICKGSISKRKLPCGNPNCRCHKDPKKRHGPYYQLSWKEKGKTISRFISPESIDLYQTWMSNRHMLMVLIDQMQAVSRKATDCIGVIDKQKNKKSKATKKTPKSREKTR